MGFDFGDVWNPIEQTRDMINAGSRGWGKITGPGNPADGGTYRNVRMSDGTIVQQPTTYGNLLSQQTGLVAPVQVNDATRQALLAQQGGLAGQFATQAEQGYGNYGQQGQASLDYLRGQMQGGNSVSAAQLQQGLQAMYGQQASQAASASPRNSAMAARTAMINSGRLGMGMTGQQAVAGLQERNQAASQYGNLIAQMRGQDLNAALQGRSNAEVGYGAQATGAPQPSWIQQYGPAIVGGVGAIATAASDRTLKTKIKAGDAAANSVISSLKPYTYAYKDPKLGPGRQVGVMAQDLEQAGLRQAVIDTPHGKYINPGKLAGANTAMIAALGKRVAALESGGGDKGGFAAALGKTASR